MKLGVSAAKESVGSSVPISPIDMARTSGRPRILIMIGPPSTCTRPRFHHRDTEAQRERVSHFPLCLCASVVVLLPPKYRARYWSDMDRPSVHRECGFLDGFVQRGMGMRAARDVLRRCAEFHADDDLGDQIAGIGADDMCTQH